MNGWISVKDKTSGNIDDVLVYCSDGSFRIAWWDGLRWTSNYEEIELYEDISVTHWMPLPEPPESEGDAE